MVRAAYPAWMPDQVRHDEISLLLRQLAVGCVIAADGSRPVCNTSMISGQFECGQMAIWPFSP